MRARLLRSTLQRFLFKKPQFFFADDASIYPKRLRSTQELNFEEMMYLEREVEYCNNQRKIIDYLEKYNGFMNDEHIANVTQNIIFYQITLDQEFNEKAAPIIAHYISLMNREHSRYFGVILKNMAFLEIKSPEIWNAILNVFYNENMKRYIPIHDLVETFIFFDHWNKPPYKLLNEIAPVIKKHRYRIPEKYSELVSQAYERVINNQLEDESILKLEEKKVEQLNK